LNITDSIHQWPFNSYEADKPPTVIYNIVQLHTMCPSLNTHELQLRHYWGTTLTLFMLQCTKHNTVSQPHQ